ncbi:MAG: autotransporter outer membrane beta-barrel domain-containing protein [Marinibacterium sp.]|nr:autotransporter outer membrane beta-barrel domain-containing protein [Marinibacterium sp.]
MFAFHGFIRPSDLDQGLAKTGPWLATVSLFALSAAIAAGPARADCTQQGLELTCSGDLGPVDFPGTGVGQGQTATLTIKNATNQSITNTDASRRTIWRLGVDAPGSTQPSGDAQLNVDLDGFALTTAGTAGIQVRTQGGDGTEPSEDKGGGDRTGDDGTNGGAGGSITSDISGVSVRAETVNIEIQTFGGGGGNGARGDSTIAGNGRGGDGGTGGRGGEISATVTGSDLQQGQGLFVRSWSGRGGTGGEGKAVGGSRGGAGGDGGAGGNIHVVVQDLQVTNATTGISVQSTGNLGGTGGRGNNSSGTATGQGGEGGRGGGGGGINLTNTAQDGTTGGLQIAVSSGQGVLAESIAGNGGAGGRGSGNPGKGGDGGQGGTAGSVTVNVAAVEGGPDASITASGDGSAGIVARSYGGAGGAGGPGTGAFVAKGGAAAGSGPGGGINVTYTGSIDTGGSRSDGILAQSVGGFAGDAGSSSGIVAYGASSESAGGAGSVIVKYDGTTSSGISTAGDDSDAIFAQSQGGGGGKASTDTGLVSLSGSETGSSGGDGNAVLVEASGDITTTGARSRGVVAQSIGGTGGDGGSARGITSIGGTGSTGGTGASVQAISSADIRTGGDDAIGILLQSIGGGGGAAGSGIGIAAIGGNGGSGADSALVTAEIGGTIATTGSGADGVLAQSIGGSGGHGGNAFSASVGFSMSIAGTGGTGSDGGEVKLQTLSGSQVSTGGDNARGLAAMSVGGGGGHGGNAISVAAGADDPAIAVAIGGSGGAGGDGAAVNLNTLGAVSTSGSNATGISAISVGGTGGSAGTTVSAATGIGSVSVAVGGDGGGGGAGGLVDVCRGQDASNALCSEPGTAGEIQTTGDGAAGLFAASIGGGGGQSGATLSGTIGGNTSIAIGGNNTAGAGSSIPKGAGGLGGDVAVLSSGGIRTSGASSGALVATSIGGSGGDAHIVGSFGTLGTGQGLNVGIGGRGGTALGSGDVSVVSTDTIATAGAISPGIEATSIGGSGGKGSTVISGQGVSDGSADISIGGVGGGGGTSGDVSVDWTGDTLTTGNEQSPGVFAMSLAGSGGNAGTTFAGQGVGLASTGLAVGGNGGLGGQAGAVSVTTSGKIQTTGFMSDGISAISQGGNGGRGGLSITGSGVSQGDADVSLGGGGGTGGTAGAVSVTTLIGSSVSTNGPNATGITALSLGGNGGQGGMAVETGINVQAIDEVPVGSASFVFGGDGHTAGASARADVFNGAAISTGDFNSPGIQAQSIAGSGGAGGMALSGTADVATSDALTARLVFGGSGGKGAAAAEASVDNVASVATTGDNSSAILAQSIGGSGGAGGLSYNILTNIASGGSTNLGFELDLGGEGNEGGAGGLASVNNSSRITTTGTSSSGIYAQSIGGNGGSGGFGGTGIYDIAEQSASEGKPSVKLNLSATLGGSGGSGAVGGAVDVVNQGGGQITTSGAGAYGIFAQSVGGNGGDGGLASNFSQSVASSDDDDENSKSVSSALTLKIGGNGNTGADAGQVTVSNQASITTTGDIAHGIMSQSVGGSGGTGGGTATNAQSFVTRQIGSSTNEAMQRLRSVHNVTTLKSDFGNFDLSIGGSGGTAGDGAASEVTNSGQRIMTSGVNAYGIFAQSIGGGGGSGGEAASITDTYSLQLGGNGAGGGNGGVASINTTGVIATQGYGSTAVFAQSIGGGGGNTGSKTGLSAIADATLAIGGKNGVAGDGGAVSVTYNSGSITTASQQASGIFAQSVGGGGGTLFGATGTLGAGATVDATVGGTGNASGNGGDVTVVSAANITTGPTTPGGGNAASIGIFAQSVGGGGGYSGSMILGDPNRIGSDVQSTSANASGDGGRVQVNQSGTITTHGDNSVGIFAQSVGGGGGVQGTIDHNSTDSSYVGSFGGKGSAGPVSVTLGGAITTSGAGAHGVFAQFASGADSVNTHGTTVDVSTSASITAMGAGAHAIHVENNGPAAGLAEITIGSGAVIYGGGFREYENSQNGAGIYIHSDQNSTLNNSGIIEAVSNVAIRSMGAGTLTINNANGGQIYGSVFARTSGSSADEAAVASPAPTTIRIENRAGGVLEAGDVLDVAHLHNQGRIHVGRSGTIGQTRLSGDLQQGGGRIGVDLDLSQNQADMLYVGGQASLQGHLDVNVLQIGTFPSGGQSLRIIEAAGGVDAAGLEVTPSVVARYHLAAVSATELHLGYDIDYANRALTQSLNANQNAMTSYFDRLYRFGELDEDLARILIDIPTAEDYARVMNALGPELAGANGATALTRTLSFADTLFSCPNPGQGQIWADDGQCGYVSFGASRLERDATDGASGYTQTGRRIAAGGQLVLENGLALGGALAYDSTDLSTDAAASSDGDTISGGLSLKRFANNWEFGGALYASNGSFDNARSFGPSVARSTQDQWMTGTELRAAYAFDQGGWVFKPRLDLGLTHFGSTSQTETGSPTALAIDTPSQTFAYLRPALEIKGAVLTRGGHEIRLNSVVSVTRFIGDTSFDTTARLVGAPDRVGAASWRTEIDKTQFDMSAGLTMVTDRGISYDISAFGHLTENERGYGGQLRINIPF